MTDSPLRMHFLRGLFIPYINFLNRIICGYKFYSGSGTVFKARFMYDSLI